MHFENQSTFNYSDAPTPAGIAFRVWSLVALLFATAVFVSRLLHNDHDALQVFVISFLITHVITLPALVLMWIALAVVRVRIKKWPFAWGWFILLQNAIAFGYALLGAAIHISDFIFNYRGHTGFFNEALVIFSLLASIILLVNISLVKKTADCLSRGATNARSLLQLLLELHHSNKKTKIEMETAQSMPVATASSNRILFKGLITGGLILLMMIPTLFIQNLVTEREQRQKEVIKEVNTKWAGTQTVSGPYLVVPYTDSSINQDGRTIAVRRQLVVLPSSMHAASKLFPEERPRSIYKVLLYRSQVAVSGVFKPIWPADIRPEAIDFSNARLCMNLSDNKGIEEELVFQTVDSKVLLQPGLPLDDLGKVGLSAPVNFSAENLSAGIPFQVNVKLKGSERLHFMPLAASSTFKIESAWPNPSFDGNVLPSLRQVNEKGFNASWNFNQANLPFSPVFFHGTIFPAEALAFGVSMVQPAGQYDKTMRSVKYAILIIGLSFALFLIIELMQKKPLHPVQYVLVGLALVIFYSLLLSMSEYILFALAYGIAAAATVLLISWYAFSHFRSWKTTLVFGLSLSCLYAFIYVLISLEDTSLLVGSIGLFMVLALVMYASRKVNWYGQPVVVPNETGVHAS